MLDIRRLSSTAQAQPGGAAFLTGSDGTLEGVMEAGRASAGDSSVEQAGCDDFAIWAISFYYGEERAGARAVPADTSSKRPCAAPLRTTRRILPESLSSPGSCRASHMARFRRPGPSGPCAFAVI